MVTVTLSDFRVGRGARLMAHLPHLTVRAGEALIVTGTNGAGKSTFLRSLGGLLPPLGGSIALENAVGVDGEPARKLAEICHYLGHRNGLKPQQTLRRNLAFWQHFLGGAGLPVAEALKIMGLEDLAEIPLGYLSAGQQRRAALARLLVSERPVWLLDEPLTALDAASQARFGRAMAEKLRGGGIIIAATHQELGLENARRLVITPPKEPETAALAEEEWTW